MTGFKWGVFTEKTSDITLDVTILFKKVPRMQDAFVVALRNLGYQPRTAGERVQFEFKNPKTPQPGSRLTLESVAQSANKVAVAKYNELKAALKWSTNDPNGFDQHHMKALAGTLVPRPVQNVAEKAQNIFARYFDKIWHNRR